MRRNLASPHSSNGRSSKRFIQRFGPVFRWITFLLRLGNGPHRRSAYLDVASIGSFVFVTCDAAEPGEELVSNRTRVLSLVTKARELEAEEAKKSATLPKNAEAIIFGYFDTLAAFRTTAKIDDRDPPSKTMLSLDHAAVLSLQSTLALYGFTQKRVCRRFTTNR
jgi:hypothetical protein